MYSICHLVSEFLGQLHFYWLRNVCSRRRICLVITQRVVRTRVERLIVHVSHDGGGGDNGSTDEAPIYLSVSLCVCVHSAHIAVSPLSVCDSQSCSISVCCVCAMCFRTTNEWREPDTGFAKFCKCSFFVFWNLLNVVIALGWSIWSGL